MIKTHTSFNCGRFYKSLPIVRVVSKESQNTTNYYHAGKNRSGERQCLFKYTLKGEGVFQYNHVKYRVKEGDAFLCVVSDPKSVYYYPKDQKTPWEFIYMTYSNGNCEDVVKEFFQLYGPVFTLNKESKIIKFLIKYSDLKYTEVDISPIENTKIISNLYSDIIHSTTQYDNKNDNQIVRKTREFIRENIKENIDISSIADKLQVSREHLTRIFKMHTGTTPYQFLVQKKILRACHLLKDTALSQKEIAEQLGYPAASHFSRTFQRVMHMTAGHFRNHGTMPSF